MREKLIENDIITIFAASENVVIYNDETEEINIYAVSSIYIDTFVTLLIKHNAPS